MSVVIDLEEYFGPSWAPHKRYVNLDQAEGTFLHRYIRENGLEAYEPETLALIVLLLQQSGTNKTFIDVGANIGLYSIVMSALFSDIRVYAFEPAPAMFDAMSRVVSANNLDVKTQPFALGAQAGVAKFYISISDCSSSLK